MNNDPDQQPAVLTIGFRPFFLVAGFYAVIAMLAWLAWLMLHGANAVILHPTISVPAHLWHGHEMLFGFTSAVIGGFMLTAVPGWTGARRVAGTSLLILTAAWLIGRAVMWFSALLPALAVAIVDMLYLVLLAASIVFAFSKQLQARNAIFLALLVILIAANGAFHAEWLGWTTDSASPAMQVALIDVVLIIAILGGRVVPSFVRNAMMRRGDKHNYPRQVKAIELTSIAGIALVLLCYVFAAPDTLTATVAMVAAIANLVRQSLWRPAATFSEPILWSLHLAYLWIPIGLSSIAASVFLDVISMSAALHVLAVGAVGGMTLAMMTRAPLGHTGRQLKVRPSIAVAYVLIALAALLRGFALDALSQSYYLIVFAAGALWVAGFVIFIIVYLPILLGPSLKSQKQD